MTRENSSEVEITLSNNTFIHVTSHETDLVPALRTMNNQLKIRDGIPFNGVTIGTAANLKSEMSKVQYQAY